MVNLLRLSNFEIEWTSDPTRHLHMPTKSKLCLFYLASFARAQCVSADRGHTFSLHNLLEIPSKLFDEIIQSYQLLFDSYSLSSVQTYHSLTTSPKLPPFYQTTTSTETQQSLRDIYLDIICGLTIISPPPKSKPRCVRLERQRFKNPMRRGSRQDKIWTAKDFTYLRSRLIFLQRRAVDKKPIGLPQLWGYDKRSLQWYTFWTLAFTAVLGIMQLVVGTLQAMK